MVDRAIDPQGNKVIDTVEGRAAANAGVGPA